MRFRDFPLSWSGPLNITSINVAHNKYVTHLINERERTPTYDTELSPFIRQLRIKGHCLLTRTISVTTLHFVI